MPYFILNVFCLLMILGMGWSSLPSSVRSAIGEQCHDHRGRFRPERLGNLLGPLASFYFGLTLMAVVISLSGLFVLAWINSDLIPMHLLGDVADQAGTDPTQWQENLTGNVQRAHTRWHVGNGGTQAGAFQIQSFLWHLFPLILVGGFFVTVIGFRLGGSVYEEAVSELFQDIEKRRRNSVREDYLRENEHRKTRRHRRKAPSHTATAKEPAPRRRYLNDVRKNYLSENERRQRRHVR